MGACGALGSGVGRAAGKGGDRIPARAAHPPSRRDQRDAIELALRGAVGRIDRVEGRAKKMRGALHAGSAHSHHGDDFALEVGQLRREVCGASDTILQCDEIVRPGVRCDDLGRDVVEPDTRATSDAEPVAAFVMLAQQHPCEARR
jgi:hypothetical protein